MRVSSEQTRQAILSTNSVWDPNMKPESLALFDAQGNPINLTGATGDRIPAGGGTGAALVKASADDFDVEWINIGGGAFVPSGGTTGQVLTKVSNSDFDLAWAAGGGGGGGGGGDSTYDVVDAFKGDWSASNDYLRGDFVRHNNSTWLAQFDDTTGLEPGAGVDLQTVEVWYSYQGHQTGYILPWDVTANMADLTPHTGYYLGGMSYWFRVQGAAGEVVTVTVVGGGGSAMHGYALDGGGTSPLATVASPAAVTIPSDGGFGLEVAQSATSVLITGPDGPGAQLGNPWVLFAAGPDA